MKDNNNIIDETDIYTVYSEQSEMTFIMKDSFSKGILKSKEVIGFYFGNSNDKDTKFYIDKLKAEF